MVKYSQPIKGCQFVFWIMLLFLRVLWQIRCCNSNSDSGERLIANIIWTIPYIQPSRQRIITLKYAKIIARWTIRGEEILY